MDKVSDISTPEARMMFMLYFSSIMSIQYHPANPPDDRMPMDEAVNVALRMCEITDRLFSGD